MSALCPMPKAVLVQRWLSPCLKHQTGHSAFSTAKSYGFGEYVWFSCLVLEIRLTAWESPKPKDVTLDFKHSDNGHDFASLS